MNELSKYLVDQILLEDKNPIKKTVVIYVGRFQPMDIKDIMVLIISRKEVRKK